MKLALRLACACSLLGVCPPSWAQASAGSDTVIVLTQSLMSGAGVSTSPSNTLQAGIAQPGSGGLAVSPSFKLFNGVVPVLPSLGTNRPIVFGVREGYGDKNGGQTVTLAGMNFTAPGAGAAVVRFDGDIAFPATVTSNTTISANVPAGTNGLANPKGAVDVEVSNSLGSSTAGDGWRYTPALAQYTAAQTGKPFQFHVVSEPGSLYVVAFGGALPGFTIPLPPFTGMLNLPTNPVLFTTVLFSPNGHSAVKAFVPDIPAIVGKSIFFQAISITDTVPPLGGSFTNVLPVLLLD